MFSCHHPKKVTMCSDDILTNLFLISMLQCIHMSKHYSVQYIHVQFSLVNYTSINIEKIKIEKKEKNLRMIDKSGQIMKEIV